MAAPDAENCLFGVKRATESLLKYPESLLKYPEKAKKEVPPQGFVGLGSFDENWGWLRYEVK